MAKKKSHPFEPDYTFPPGATLEETIEALGMTQTELAVRTLLAQKTVNQIIRGVAPITPETALKLEKVTGVEAAFWNALETGHRSDLLRLEEKKSREADVAWAKRFPVSDLKKRGAIPGDVKGAGLVDALLRFFGTVSKEAWEALWLDPAVQYRRSKAFESAPYAVASWLRLGEVAAQGRRTEPFSKPRFETALREIRSLTAAEPDSFIPEMEQRCAAAGVAVVLVPEIPRAGVYGATRWLTDAKALIQLSLYRKSNDQFWFSFFHEAAHVLKHGKRQRFIESGAREPEVAAKEAEADRFAADLLIPPEHVPAMRKLRHDPEIVRFAGRLGIAPGIVAGRLQREGILPCSHGNALKVRYRWG